MLFALYLPPSTVRACSDATYGLNTANYQKRFSKLPNFRCGEALEMGSSQAGRDLLLGFSSSLSYFIDFSPLNALMSGIRTHPKSNRGSASAHAPDLGINKLTRSLRYPTYFRDTKFGGFFADCTYYFPQTFGYSATIGSNRSPINQHDGESAENPAARNIYNFER
jgi:hypothetical protein